VRFLPRDGAIRLVFALGIISILVMPVQPAPRAAESLPSRISDETFWKMVTDMSEPDGYFRFENFVSNEMAYQFVIPRLLQTVKPGDVYMGVAPEQNFTYIAALKPKIAFIVDIRRQNMIELLMYKALFEISETRADFLSNLFARRRPVGLSERSSVTDLFSAYRNVKADAELYGRNLQQMKDLLTGTHKFGLRETDLNGRANSIDYVYETFMRSGPYLEYDIGNNNPTYADLMEVDDGAGQTRSFLANEQNYRFVREMQMKNLIVPLVGDFAGPKTIRAVGQYVRDHDAVVTTFYLSNVEQYLFDENKAADFFRNVDTLPLDRTSTFIRTFSGSGGFGGFRFASALASMTGMLDEFKAGRVRQYGDIRSLSK
jgi:hypothetical protein